MRGAGMKKNVCSTTERWARAAIGIVFLFLFALPGGWGWLSVIGLILLATAFLQYCPINQALGLGTCAKKNEDIG